MKNKTYKIKKNAKLLGLCVVPIGYCFPGSHWSSALFGQM